MASTPFSPSRRLVLAGALALPATAAFGDEPVLVRGLEVSAASDGARLSVALSRSAAPRAFFLAGPDRFVVDIPNARFALGREPQPAGPVSRVRRAVQPDGAARIVLDLAGPAQLGRQEIGGRREPGFSFDLVGASPSIPLTAAAAPPPLRRVDDGRRHVIVVDAGHGGHDPGALGVTGLREKDVVLDTALNLRDALESRGRYRVALTRDADVFLPLPERVRIARDQGADLFLSLHADANANGQASGASVYTLSERGGARARGMIDAQDWAVDLGEAPRSGLVTQILTDLTQRETNNRSVTFAQTLITGLDGAAPLLGNTHRNAGFYVLLAPDVPAALLEMGFLTNAQDERRLADQRARLRMADAVASSIDHYFAQQGVYLARA